MDYETRFPKQLVEVSELADLVERMAKMAGASVVADEVIIVSTDDVEFSSVLDTLADRLIATAKPRGKKSAPKAEKRLGLHSYRNETTGDVVSKQWINKQLTNNELARGTVFVNGRDERFVVAEVNVGAPFLLVKEGEQA